MTKKDIILYGIATGITAVLNFIMSFIVLPDNSQTSISISNLFVLIVAVFLFWLVTKGGKNANRTDVRFERYTIWMFPAASVIWFVNRIMPNVIPDIANYIAVVTIFLVGTLSIVAAYKRNR